MATSDLGLLLLRLAADAGQFESDLGRAARIADKNARAIEKRFIAVGAAVGTALAGVAGTVGELTRRAINTADEMGKTAQKVGLAVEAFSTLSFAAEQSGVNVQQLQTGLVKLSRTASDAATGSQAAAAGFDAIGVSVKDAQGNLKTTDQLLLEVADKFSGYRDSTEKVALATQLFGRAGAELIPLLNAGADGIRALQEEARALGLEISTDTYKAAEQFNDLMNVLSKVVSGFALDIAQSVLPGLVALAKLFADNAKAGRESAGAAQFFADAIKAVIGVTITAVAEIKKLGAVAGAAFVGVQNGAKAIATQFENVARLAKESFTLGPVAAYSRFLQSGFNSAGQAIEGARQNLARLGEGFDEIDREAEERVAALATGFKGLSTAIGGETGEGVVPRLRNYGEEAKAAATAAAELAKAQKLAQDSAVRATLALVAELEANDALAARFDETVQSLEDELRILSLVGDEREAEIIRMEAERLARDANNGSIEESVERYRELLTQIADARKIADAAAQLERIWLDAANSIGDALTDALFDGAKSGAEAVKDVMQQLARDLVRFWIQQKIVIPLQQQLVGNASGGAGIGGTSGGGLFGGTFGTLLGGASVGYGISGNAGGAILGAAGGFLGSAFGPLGTAIGSAIGGAIASLFGGNKPPDFRLGGVGVTRKPEGEFTSQLGTFQFGARGLEGGERELVNAITTFDNQIAQLVGSISGGDEQLQRIRDALSQWAIDLRGSAVTAENVLGQRFDAILRTFDADIQAFVRGGATLQEQVERLAEVLAKPDQLNQLLEGLRLEDFVAGLTQAERQLFQVNRQFDEYAAAAAALGASQEQLAEIEELRANAIGRLSGETADATDGIIRQIERIADILGDAQFEDFVAGLSPLEAELAETRRRFAEAEAQLIALGASEGELIQLRDLEARALGRIIAADAAAEFERIADAVATLAGIVSTIDAEIADLSAGSDFQRTQQGIARSYAENVAALNEAARAAGLAAAREEDLARALQLATLQRVRAIQALEQEGRRLVQALGFDALSQIDQQIAALQQQESGASIVRDFGDAMQEASQAASDAINLLLGDLSPLKDAQKLPLALQALQAGQVGPEDVLRIAQRLFASGTDYNRIFAQVQAIGDRRGIGSAPQPSGGPEQTISAALRELLDQRDLILAQQQEAERFTNANQLAQVIADLAGARGEDFAAIAESLGLSGLDQLLTDLRLDSLESLDAYLTSLQADSYSLADLAATITAGEQLIVDTLREIAGLDSGIEATPFIGNKPLPGFEEGDFIGKSLENEQAMLEELRALRQEVAELRAGPAQQTADATHATAIAQREIADTLAGERLNAEARIFRSDRRPALPGMGITP
jgi:hypothetical protein